MKRLPNRAAGRPARGIVYGARLEIDRWHRAMRSWISWAGVAGRAAWVPAARGERDPQRSWLSVLADMTEFLDVPGRWIAYEVTGSGPLVVLSHGIGVRWQDYRFLAPMLAQAGYRVASADLRGHGESSMGWASITRTDVAGDLLALIAHLGGPAVIVGHSARSRSSNRRSERPLRIDKALSAPAFRSRSATRDWSAPVRTFPSSGTVAGPPLLCQEAGRIAWMSAIRI